MAPQLPLESQELNPYELDTKHYKRTNKKLIDTKYEGINCLDLNHKSAIGKSIFHMMCVYT
jgi:hypothetical protein